MTGKLDCIIDVSKYQPVINFEALKASGVIAIIHKATQGYTGKDPLFLKRQKICRELGFLFGSYHFATSANTTAQMNNYLGVIGDNPDELMVIDYEFNRKDTASLQQLREMVQIIFERTGRYPVIYSGAEIKEQLGDDEDELLKNCPLWISQYRFGAPAVPANWSTWSFHQYTDGNEANHKNAKGNLLYPRVDTPGVGFCDRNYFNGDIDGLKEIWNAPASEVQAQAIEGEDRDIDPDAKPAETT